MKATLKKRVLEQFKRAEGLKRYPLRELFNDVYGGGEEGMPWNIKEQRAELKGLIEKYGGVGNRGRGRRPSEKSG